MQKFFYRTNNKFFLNFHNNIMRKWKSIYLHSDTSFLKIILEEINELFRKISGRLVSRRDIPTPDNYPDSKKFNKIVNDISTDLEKIYIAQSLINDDLKNIIHYNSIEREQTFHNYINVQQKVLMAYALSKKDELGYLEIPENSPFISADNMSKESIDVKIDNRQRLTLGLENENKLTKPIDIDNVHCYLTDKTPDILYPTNKVMAVGSHWKQDDSPHFIDYKNKTETHNYKKMMIDDEINNFSVGICEFESVYLSIFRLYDRYPQPHIRNIKNYIGQKHNTDNELIYIDMPNSLQSQYISNKPFNINTLKHFKLSVPFTNDAPLTNEIQIKFSQKVDPPKIIWSESKVYSKSNQNAYSILESTTPVDGHYSCYISQAIIPTRLELALEYVNTPWEDIGFYMSWYVFSVSQAYSLPTSSEPIRINMNKIYNVFVESEKNQLSERNRAVGVLTNLSNNQGI